MKRQHSNDSFKKKGYQVQKKCVICKTQEARLHRITADEVSQIYDIYNIVVTAGQRACCRHWVPHSNEIFKNDRPALLSENAIKGTTPSKRKTPTKRQKTTPVKPLKERSQKQLVQLVAKYEKELKALKARVEELEGLVDTMKQRPYEAVFQLCTEKNPEGTFQLLGISKFDELLSKVGATIKVRGWESEELLKYGLLWARQGLSSIDLGLYLNLDRRSAAVRMEDWVNKLFPWAQTQIKLPSVEAWKRNTPENLAEIFPDHLFLFVDGTVLKVWTPVQPKVRRNMFNSKHGYCAWVFFIVVDPSGHIVYLSDVDIGHTHDATHWNGSDAVKLLTDTYSNVMKKSKKTLFCMGGDKAYPNMNLPENWHLFVTMTAEDTPTTESTTSNKTKKSTNNASTTTSSNKSMLIGNSTNRHRSPEIARWRCVVERSIGAIKKWKILENIPYLSHVETSQLQKLLTVICALVNWERTYNNTSW